MGCDIHVQLEVKKDGCWTRVCGPFKCWACKGVPTVPRKCVWCDGSGKTSEVWEERNYVVFGILAGVRCDYFPAIAKPRGIPSDVSDEVKAIVVGSDRPDDDLTWLGDHSYSYVTFAELENYDLTRPAIYHAVVGLSDWFKWDGVSPPERASGGIGGGGWKTFTQLEAKQWLAVNGIPPEPTAEQRDRVGIFDEPTKRAVAITWVQTAETSGLSDLIEAIRCVPEVVAGMNTSDVRIVFGFDS